MNTINLSLSDLNDVICALHPKIKNLDLPGDFNSLYSIVCLSNIKSALVESAILIYNKLPEDQKEEYLSQLFDYDILTQKDLDFYSKFV